MSRARRPALVALVATGLLLQGCSSDAVGTADPVDEPADAGVLATTGCDAPERQQLQAGGHLLADEPPPVPWNSIPPTSGWHASGASVEPGAYAEPVSEADQVLWLEQGGIVVSYDPALADDVIGQLNVLSSEGSLTVVTPYEVEMPTPIALTAWGWLQRCESVTPEVVEAFADAYGRGGVPH